MNVRAEIETAVQDRVVDMSPLSGGCIGHVYRVRLTGGESVVVKHDGGPAPKLGIEAAMLRYLGQHSQLPVPDVLHGDDHLLIISFLPGNSHFSAAAQHHAAELLATLHQITAPTYGFEQDTLIGGLHQPNPPTDSWLDFFCRHRLLYMAQEGIRSGRLPSNFRSRLDRFCHRINHWLAEPERPSLIHGDAWTTNILAVDDRITGFLDPAIYYADPEIELAFTTLFGTFGQPFFARYQEILPLAPGFFDTRRDIYNLYPLLVHVRLFGGSYVHSVDTILKRFGC